MPHYHIFHQNLRVFGGRSDDRNDPFRRAFGQIANAIGQDRVFVAGFTEVMNKRTTRMQLARFARRLDQDLGIPTLYATGVTAVGTKTEYVGISISSGFTRKIHGKVLQLADNTWKAYDAQTLASDEMPNDNYALDVRGLAYVGGKFLGQKVLVGFIHNNYTLGEKSTIYRALPKMVEAIRRTHSDWADFAVYLGGDFNLYPDDLNATYKAYYARNNQNRPIKTTKYHPYDFWVTDDPGRSYADAQIFTQSRWDVNKKLSDHAGVALQII